MDEFPELQANVESEYVADLFQIINNFKKA